jgi:hypothetical protein
VLIVEVMHIDEEVGICGIREVCTKGVGLEDIEL